jgi:hypothetical protein
MSKYRTSVYLVLLALLLTTIRSLRFGSSLLKKQEILLSFRGGSTSSLSASAASTMNFLTASPTSGDITVVVASANWKKSSMKLLYDIEEWQSVYPGYDSATGVAAAVNVVSLVLDDDDDAEERALELGMPLLLVELSVNHSFDH